MLRRCFMRHSIAEKSAIQQAVQRINSTILKPLDPRKKFVPALTDSMPMAILLGNHSAGKSSLVNALTGSREQQTGVAPTDDGFTVLLRGDVDMTEDGPTALANEQYGFDELRGFGNDFVNRFRVKTRKLEGSAEGVESLLPPGMMIVDTPGMIDTPVQVSGTARTSMEGQHRGYDFLKVTQWFAKRADIILLMFDPANPGTTGETLDVLQQSLRGHEFKFLILLNKVDQFEKVTDFARCYGSLCWNLSKNIPHKDIPRVYTTFTKSGEVRVNPNPAVPLSELEENRHQVIQELLLAPMRRMDNLLTESEEAARRIRMMAKVTNAVVADAKTNRRSKYALGVSAMCVVPSCWLAVVATLDLTVSLGLGMGAVAGLGLFMNNLQLQMEQFERQIKFRLDEYVDREYPSADEDLKQRWKCVRPFVEESVKSHGAYNLPVYSKSQLKQVDHVIESEFPELRKRVRKYKADSMQNTSRQQQQQHKNVEAEAEA